MKKLSISVFAIMAVVFAVTSAFTGTSKKVKANTLEDATYFWYKNLTPVVTPNPTAAQIEAQNAKIDEFTTDGEADQFGVPTSSISEGAGFPATQQGIDDYIAEVCQPSEADPVCLLLIKRQDGVNPTVHLTVRGVFTPLN
jgi:hypothetical protein